MTDVTTEVMVIVDVWTTNDVHTPVDGPPVGTPVLGSPVSVLDVEAAVLVEGVVVVVLDNVDVPVLELEEVVAGVVELLIGNGPPVRGEPVLIEKGGTDVVVVPPDEVDVVLPDDVDSLVLDSEVLEDGEDVLVVLVDVPPFRGSVGRLKLPVKLDAEEDVVVVLLERLWLCSELVVVE